MRIKSYNEALTFARCAGEDAANRRMRKAGREVWSEADYAHGLGVMKRVMIDLGYDVPGWIATAGMTRNIPDEPAPGTRRKRGGKARQQPAEQLKLALV